MNVIKKFEQNQLWVGLFERKLMQLHVYRDGVPKRVATFK